MLRGTIIGIALAAVLGAAAPAKSREPRDPAPAAQPCRHTAPHAHAPLIVPASGVAVAQSTSCASECQARHDRCRVETKGSPSCDSERQRCLEVCLQRKKR